MRLPDLIQEKRLQGRAHNDICISVLDSAYDIVRHTYTIEGAIYRRDFLSDLLEDGVIRAHFEEVYRSIPKEDVYSLHTDGPFDSRSTNSIFYRAALLTKWIGLPKTLERLAELPGGSQGTRDLRSFAKRARKSLNEFVPLAERLSAKPVLKASINTDLKLEELEADEIDVSWGEYCIDQLRPHMARLRNIADIRHQMQDYRRMCKPYEWTFNGQRIPSCKPEFLDPELRQGIIRNAYHPDYFSITRARKKRKDVSTITALNVPNDIRWGDDARNTFIQGPNSQGKSVYLETIALNLHLPMAGLRCFAESAELSPVGAIFPCFDMGDSMGEGHFGTGAKKVRHMLENVTRNDIVLLDEVAGGTEPEAERRIARGISDALIKYGVTTFNTTHDRAAWTKHRGNPDIAFLRVADLMDEERRFKVWPGIAKGGYGMEKAKELGVDPESADEALRRLAQ